MMNDHLCIWHILNINGCLDWRISKAFDRTRASYMYLTTSYRSAIKIYNILIYLKRDFNGILRVIITRMFNKDEGKNTLHICCIAY